MANFYNFCCVFCGSITFFWGVGTLCCDNEEKIIDDSIKLSEK